MAALTAFIVADPSPHERPQASRSLRLDGDLVANIFDVAVQEVSHVLHYERNAR